MADASLVCFPIGRCDLDAAAKVLAAHRLSVVRMGDELHVSLGASPVFRITYAEGDYVARESSEMARGNERAEAMLPCAARLEILIDDLDRALDEANTLIDLQIILAEATGGFVFNCWTYRGPPPPGAALLGPSGDPFEP